MTAIHRPSTGTPASPLHKSREPSGTDVAQQPAGGGIPVSYLLNADRSNLPEAQPVKARKVTAVPEEQYSGIREPVRILRLRGQIVDARSEDTLQELRAVVQTLNNSHEAGKLSALIDEQLDRMKSEAT